MTDGSYDIARLSEAGVSDDGTSVRFRIDSTDGRAIDVSCDHARIEGLIHYIAGLGQMSAARRDQVTPHRFGATDNVAVSPLDISDVGLMRGLESDEAVLVVRLFGFDLGFSVTPFQLRALHDEIERMMPTSSPRPGDHHHHRHDDSDDGG